MKTLEENKTKEIIEKNNLLKNPLIKGFLNNEENYHLFQKAILFPNLENKNKVEEVFAKHYEQVRIDSYFRNLIKYFSIDFDKKIRKLNNRFYLTLDKPIGTESETITHKDLIPEENKIKFGEQTLHNEIGDESLFQALEILSESQYRILELIYVKNLTNIEIAGLMNSSPQNISNIHRKAIRKLRKDLVGEL